MKLSRAAAVVGVGASSFERRPETSVLEMVGDAFAAALDDAGLEKQAIDGLVVHIGSPRGADHDVVAQTFGPRSQVLFADVATRPPDRHGRGASGDGCRFRPGYSRCLHPWREEFEHGRLGEANNPYFYEQFRENDGPHAEEGHIGMSSSPVGGAAMALDLYCKRYGVDRELLAEIPLTFRRHARLNPDAVAQQELTIEAYRSAREIVAPIRLFDCSLVGDGAICVIVAAADQTVARKPPIWITGVQGVHASRDTFIFAPRGLGMAQQSAKRLTRSEARSHGAYRMAGVSPDDIDVLGVYDSFSPLPIYTLEDFGFCEAGEGLAWVQAGRVGLGGELPTNTNGGQLSHAQLNGWGQIRELVTQLRGEASGRQVAGAQTGMWATIAGDAIIFQRD